MFPGFNQHANCKLGQQQSITFLKLHPPYLSLSLTHTYTLYLVLPFALEVRYCPTYLDDRPQRLRLVFCCSVADCLAPSRLIQSPTWPGRYATWPQRGQRKLESYTILQERSKRICAYLTSPLDGEITERWAAVKSCDWRLSG